MCHSFVHLSHLVRQFGGKLAHQSKLYVSDSTNLFDTFTHDAPRIRTTHRVDPALKDDGLLCRKDSFDGICRFKPFFCAKCQCCHNKFSQFPILSLSVLVTKSDDSARVQELGTTPPFEISATRRQQFVSTHLFCTQRLIAFRET